MSIAAYHAGATERLHAIVAVVCKFHGRDPDAGNDEFLAAMMKAREAGPGLAQRNAAIASASDADVRRRIEEVDKAVEDLVEKSWIGQVNADWSRAQFRLRDALRALEPFAGEVPAAVETPTSLMAGSPPLLSVNLSRKQLEFEGTVHDVASELALRWVKVLAEHPGEWITERQLKDFDVELDGARVRDFKDKLPEPVQLRIESKSGAGSRFKVA